MNSFAFKKCFNFVIINNYVVSYMKNVFNPWMA